MQQTHSREEAVFQAALEIEAGAPRETYLADACADQPELRRRVDALLRRNEESAGPLDRRMAAPAATVVLPSTEQAGAEIGPYRLLQKLGEGGMGVVYMAEQTEPVQRRVALKIIKPGMDTRQVIARFDAERQALALMDHPNIARVLDAGTTGGVGSSEFGMWNESDSAPPGIPHSEFRIPHSVGRPYFVMELVKGLPITQFCDEHYLSPRERLELFLPICQAVQHAHQKGIIHRDLKPSNILVAEYDDRAVPKIIDFGVAKAVSQRLTEQTMFTQYGQIVGTIEYMSPEQARLNQLDVDTRSDIYSLGVLLYELLTGETPFDKQRLRTAAFDELLRIIREEEPPRPSTRLSSSETLPSIAANRHLEPHKLTTLVRGELDWIVMKCLEKDRSRRYETATGLAHDIERYLQDEPVQACPPSATYRLRKFARRHTTGLGIAGMLVCFIVLLASGIGWTVRDHAARQQKEARDQAARVARVVDKVGLIMQEVETLEHDQKWPEALAAAMRAQAVLDSGEADQQTRDRVHQALVGLGMVARLEQIRLEGSIYLVGKFDSSGIDRKYAQAFREYGVDLETLDARSAAEQIRGSLLAVPLATGIDEWVDARRKFAPAENRNWQELVAVAQAADPDPARCALRRLWGQNVTEETRQELTQLAPSERLLDQPASTLCLLATTLTRGGAPEEAIRVLRFAQQKYPDDFWVNLSLGNALWRESPELGVYFFTVAVALRPHSSAAHTNLGIALYETGQVDEAIFRLRKAIEIDPGNPFALVDLGLALVDKGLLDEAIDCHRKAIEIMPQAGLAHMNLGDALKQKGRIDDAISSYRSAIEIDPKLAAPHNNLGLALKEKGQLAAAIAEYREAVHLEPDDAVAYLNLAYALRDAKQSNEAIAAFQDALRFKERLSRQNLADLYRDTARLYLDAGNLSAGREYYQMLVDYEDRVPVMGDPESPAGKDCRGTSYLWLGDVCLRQNDREAALGYLSRSLELRQEFVRTAEHLPPEANQELADSYAMLAWALAAEGPVRQDAARRAVELAGKAVELVPGKSRWSVYCGNFWKVLGIAHYRAGNWNDSLAAFEKSAMLNGGSGEQWFFQAMAHWKLGDREKSFQMYDQAVGWVEAKQPQDERVSRFREEAAALFGIRADLGPGEQQRFAGHSGGVFGVAFSPDDRFVLTGSADTTVRLWETETGKELATFSGHTSLVFCVAFSPDGRLAASGGGDGTIRVWDAASAGQRHCLTGHTHVVTSVAFSPDGRQILSAGDDGTIRVWDVDSGQEVRRVANTGVSVRCVAWFPDGKRAVSGGYDNLVHLWDADSGTELARYEGHAAVVTSVAISPDGRQVLSGANDATLRLWDAAGGEALLSCRHSAGVESVAFSPDGRTALATCQSNHVAVWDLESGTLLRRFQGHTGSIHGVACSRDGRYGLSGGGDGMARLWRLTIPAAEVK